MTTVTLAVLLSRMEAVLLLKFATAKSGFPSKLMSPMLTDQGLVPVVKSTLVAKVGVVALVAVVLSRMEAVLLPLFATAKSGFPSPLMSPMLTEMGLLPVGKSTLGAKPSAAVGFEGGFCEGKFRRLGGWGDELGDVPVTP